jgi:hypothetical protein
MPTNIFINYRRGDTAATAGRLRDQLVREFGANHVFMDVDNIPPGVDFSEHLREKLAKCADAGIDWPTVAQGREQFRNAPD